LEAKPASVYRGWDRKICHEPEPSGVFGELTDAIWTPLEGKLRPGI
jgi:hypothetical protein